MWEGTVVSIHVAAEASTPMQSITEVRAFPGRGLAGDRYLAETGFYSKKPSHGGREVTLIEVEAVEALLGGVVNASGERLGIKLAPADTRRNIATCELGTPFARVTCCLLSLPSPNGRTPLCVLFPCAAPQSLCPAVPCRPSCQWR